MTNWDYVDESEAKSMAIELQSRLEEAESTIAQLQAELKRLNAMNCRLRISVVRGKYAAILPHTDEIMRTRREEADEEE